MGQNFSSEPVVEKETERDHNDTFNVAVSSCQGWRVSQEDNHNLILDLPGQHKASFFAVYDGHGSAKVSEYASDTLWRHLVENELYIKGHFREALQQSFLTFDREVDEVCNAKLAGTTAVCLLIVDNLIYCANIGDSRAVACVNCECVPLSFDHKPDNPEELRRILAAGGYVLGNRVNGNLALSRAFGDFHYKGNFLFPPESQIVSSFPDIEILDLNDNVDFLVLACDGIWDVLSSEEVVEFVIARLEQSMEPGLICEQLTTRCLATDYELVIGCDNMTVLLICHTRGRSWQDFCTDIFNKNTKKLGVPRTRTTDSGCNVETMIERPSSTTATNNPKPRTSTATNPVQGMMNGRDYLDMLSNVLSSALTVGNTDDSSSNEADSDRAKRDQELLVMTQNKQEEGEAESSVLRKVDQEPPLEEATTILDDNGNSNKATKEPKDEKSTEQQSAQSKQQECESTKQEDDQEKNDDTQQAESENSNDDDKTCKIEDDKEDDGHGDQKAEANQESRGRDDDEQTDAEKEHLELVETLLEGDDDVGDREEESNNHGDGDNDASADNNNENEE